MKLETKADLVLWTKIINKLAQEGMFHTMSLDAVMLCYNSIKRARGTHQPYADNYKLDPSYIKKNFGDKYSMEEDIALQVKKLKETPVGQRLAKQVADTKTTAFAPQNSRLQEEKTNG